MTYTVIKAHRKMGFFRIQSLYTRLPMRWVFFYQKLYFCLKSGINYLLLLKNNITNSAQMKTVGALQKCRAFLLSEIYKGACDMHK